MLKTLICQPKLDEPVILKADWQAKALSYKSEQFQPSDGNTEWYLYAQSQSTDEP